MNRFVFFVLCALTATPAAQQPDPAFEVASVKENVSGDTSYSYRAERGTFQTRNMELRWIIGQAYAPGPPFTRPPMAAYHVLLGGDPKILSTRFDIEAKGADDVTPQQLQQMLRQLLADRFKLRIHTEVRQHPIYLLQVARDGQLGPNLRPSAHDCRAFRAAGGKRDDPANPRDANGELVCWGPLPTGDHLTMVTTLRNAGPIADLILGIQQALDRPVVDATGLTGSFEWNFAFSRIPIDSALEATRGDDVFAALPKQLGLRLEARTGPLEVPVIDSVEMPTPN